MTLPAPLDGAHAAPLAAAKGPASGGAARGARTVRGQADRLLTGAGSFGRRAVGKAVRVGLGPLGSRLHRLRADVDITRTRLDVIQGNLLDIELTRERIEDAHLGVELLRTDVRVVGERLSALGQAIAPTAGVDAAGARFAELREQVNALERRVRRLDGELERALRSGEGHDRERVADDPRGPELEPEPAAAAAATPPVFLSERFNYVAFERRFRGDPADVLRIQTERYADLLAAHSPVVDIGCGRGELLAVLAERGVECLGVEPDAGMVAEARARGLDIVHDDAIGFLRARPPASIGALFSAHVVEHVSVEVMLELIELAVTRLRPGGLFVAETPNPASLIVLGESFILDPTHVRPVHPALMAFLCETAGFRDVRLEFYAPADHHRLATLDDPAAPGWAQTLDANFRTLNDVLFGPQDYAVIAAAPPSGQPSS